MNELLIIIGTWLVAFIIMQLYGAEKFKGGSNAWISAIFATGVALIVGGLL